ncbi:hypothetical protein V865_007849 [Kwoniella europaea PYCC6329]|uniref:YCII-related domain-containing protein n=1 Tax=Kwoniella europaea PYCC6329 TaxID=1423913 RepID=A0AAX4KTL4_9TREE
MPLYICICPDAQGSLDKRRQTRAEHLALGQKDRAEGRTVFGRAFIDDSVSHHDDRSPPEVPSGELSSGTKGSTMIYRYQTIEQAWSRLRADPYWIEGVWDKDRTTIHELAPGPNDDTIRVM